MTPRRNRLSRWDWALIGVLAAAVLLRLPYLTQRSLWYDEASSWQTATFPLGTLIASLRLNVHMPLYYILLKGWMSAWGDSIASLRGFSVLFGTLTVFLMHRFALELYPVSAAGDASAGGRQSFALVVAGLVATSPFQVLGSIEARMYSLGTTLTALTAWLLLRILRTGSPGLWWPYGAACVSLLYSHHYGLFTIGAQFLFLFFNVIWLMGLGQGAPAWALAKRAGAAGGLIALAYLPGLQMLRTQTSRVQADYWIPELTWRKFSGTFSEFLIPTHGFDFLLGGWVVFGVAAVSCAIVAVRARRGDGLVLALALVPMLAVAAISTNQPLWVARYFRFTHLFLLTAVALAVWKISRRAPYFRSVLLVLLFGIQFCANVFFWKYLDIPNGPGVAGAVALIMAKRAPDELIVALDHHQYFPAKYYVGQRARLRLLEPAPELYWGWHLIRRADVVTPGQMRQELRRGVWTIGVSPAPAVLAEAAGDAPLEEYRLTYYMSLHRDLFVHHYKIPDRALMQERGKP